MAVVRGPKESCGVAHSCALLPQSEDWKWCGGVSCCAPGALAWCSACTLGYVEPPYLIKLVGTSSILSLTYAA
eukprot:1157556-Pelagomonas_calceolata.AAC.10